MKAKSRPTTSAGAPSSAKPGAKTSVKPTTILPPAKVSADHGVDDTQCIFVSHEPGHVAVEPHVCDAGLESFASDGDGGGQQPADTHSRRAASESFPNGEGGGQRTVDTQAVRAASENLTGHCEVETQFAYAGQDQGQIAQDAQNGCALIQSIRARYRLRIFYRENAAALERRVFAYCYQLTQGDKAQATKMAARVFKNDPPLELLALRCDLLVEQRDALIKEQKAQEKIINKLVKGLPAWKWVEAFKGLGPGGFGEIVAHCGDLASYDNPAKLWKRMGLAVFASSKDGRAISQRKCKDKADAELHGFSPRRRAVMHCLGEAILRGRRLNPEYGDMYDRRKELESAKPEVESKMHAHKRALRYIEKRLLRDLWRAWRAECGQVVDDTHPGPAAPAPESLQEAA